MELLGGEVYPGDRVVTQGAYELGGFFTPGVLKLNPEAERSMGVRVEPAAAASVDASDADGQRHRSADGAPSWDDIERRSFLQVVHAHRGSRKALAEKLGLSERTLYRKLRQYQHE